MVGAHYSGHRGQVGKDGGPPPVAVALGRGCAGAGAALGSAQVGVLLGAVGRGRGAVDAKRRQHHLFLVWCGACSAKKEKKKTLQSS